MLAGIQPCKALIDGCDPLLDLFALGTVALSARQLLQFRTLILQHEALVRGSIARSSIQLIALPDGLPPVPAFGCKPFFSTAALRYLSDGSALDVRFVVPVDGCVVLRFATRCASSGNPRSSVPLVCGASAAVVLRTFLSPGSAFGQSPVRA
ncbi:MAG: hypothetical protein IPF41_16940 [Flavobacteriales bacterium]|nr:hypothetical protein [Flavobacteriales bacterium]